MGYYEFNIYLQTKIDKNLIIKKRKKEKLSDFEQEKIKINKFESKFFFEINKNI
jgi:hypothetical protein